MWRPKSSRLVPTASHVPVRGQGRFSWVSRLTAAIVLLVVFCCYSVPRPIPSTAPNNGVITLSHNRTIVFFLVDSYKFHLSRRLRGTMISNELRKLRPDWQIIDATFSNFRRSTFISSNPVNVNTNKLYCILIKTHDDGIVDICRKQLRAKVLFDAVDRTLYSSQAHDRDFLKRKHIDAMILQTEAKVAEATALGVPAYYVPHQHTNIQRLHRAPASHTGPPKTFALLTGSPATLPNSTTLLQLANAVHGHLRNADFILVQQGTQLPLETVLTTYRYDDASNDWVRRVSTSQDPRHMRSAEDPFVQLPFHQHPIFGQADVAILWPPSQDEKTQLRPPTRLLFWMSHGIPVVFYPYTSYLDIATKFSYYSTCLDATAAHEMHNIRDPTMDLQVALQRLVPQTVRQCLSAKGLEIAEIYSITAIARRYIEVIAGR